MEIVAAVYARNVETYEGTTFDPATRTYGFAKKAGYVAGSLIGFVTERDGLFYLMNDEKTKVYGGGEYVSPALKMRSRAMIAARRHFGKNIIVA